MMKPFLMVMILTTGLLFKVYASDCVEPAYAQYNKEGMVKGEQPAAPGSPAKGVEYLKSQDVLNILEQNKASEYVFIDTRPDDLFKECSIKGAINRPFMFFGTGELDKKEIDSFVSKGKKIVFFCNSLKCYRSLNAAITASCHYGVTPGKVFWFGEGTSGLSLDEKGKKHLQGTNCDTLNILIKGKKEI